MNTLADAADIAANEIAELKILGKSLTAIQNNATSGSIQIQIPTDYDFIIDDFRCEATLNAAGGGALAGTPLSRVCSPTLASNTFYSSWLVNIGLSVKSENIIDPPQPLPAICGDAKQSTGLLIGRRIPAGTVIKIPVENYTGTVIDVYATLIGRKVTKRGS